MDKKMKIKYMLELIQQNQLKRLFPTIISIKHFQKDFFIKACRLFKLFLNKFYKINEMLYN